MAKTRKFATVVLAVGMFMSMSTSAFAQDSSTVNVNNSTNIPIVSSQAVEDESDVANDLGSVRSLSTVKGTNTGFYDQYDVKFGFKASVDVRYDNSTNQYHMFGILAEVPSVTKRPFSKVNAIPENLLYHIQMEEER